MNVSTVKASFPTGESLEGALSDLRRFGAIRCVGDLGAGPFGGDALLRVTVRAEDASLTRAVIRRAGGRIIF